MKEQKILSYNLALAKHAEKQQEKQRVKHGLIPAPRPALIDRTYSHVPRGLLTHIAFYRKN